MVYEIIYIIIMYNISCINVCCIIICILINICFYKNPANEKNAKKVANIFFLCIKYIDIYPFYVFYILYRHNQ